MKLVKEINLQNGDSFASVDTISLFTKVPEEEVLQVIRNRQSLESSFPERSTLQVKDVMELLDICLTTKHFSFDVKFY
jgi:hypothetical protein